MTPTQPQRIALGTAQFGLDYGVTNTAGRVAPDDITHVLNASWRGGINLLDTAAAYGGSEESLGQALDGQHGRPWRLITKTVPLRKDTISASDIAVVAQGFAASLHHLRTDGVETLLVHHAQDLLAPGGEALYGWLREQQTAGRTLHIGVSVYGSEETVRLLEKFSFDVVQLPASLADQHLLRDGTVDRLARAGVEIHVRSLYLQGLLLADPAFVASRFPKQAAWALALREECHVRGFSPLQACVSFFRSQAAFKVAVVGATRVEEVDALLAAWDTAPVADWSGWAVQDTEFTDPREWNKT